jgi:tRNA-dihydrouridine synthase 2
MVRVGTLPFRLLALKYGADAVYAEELIDRKICACTRVENKALGTTDFLANDGYGIVFRTCDAEKGRVVYQIGSGDAVLALKAAQMVEKDVTSIDINMGCPKNFSVAGGMGAALLRTPEVASDIIKTLRRNLSIPVTCKVRLLEDTSKSLDFLHAMEKAGAMAIAIHCRERHERTEPAHWDRLQPLVSALSVPVIANGDIWSTEDGEKVRAMSGCDSVMAARGALLNCSMFRPEGPLPPDQVIRDYLQLAVETGNVDSNTKYNVMRCMSAKDIHGKTHFDKYPVKYASIVPLKTTADIMNMWGMKAEHDQELAQQAARSEGVRLIIRSPVHYLRLCVWVLVGALACRWWCMCNVCLSSHLWCLVVL